VSSGEVRKKRAQPREAGFTKIQSVSAGAQGGGGVVAPLRRGGECLQQRRPEKAEENEAAKGEGEKVLNGVSGRGSRRQAP